MKLVSDNRIDLRWERCETFFVESESAAADGLFFLKKIFLAAPRFDGGTKADSTAGFGIGVLE